MKLQSDIISICIVCFCALILSSCSLNPQSPLPPDASLPSAQDTFVATIQIENVTQASYSAGLRYISSDSVPMTGLALRLVFPKQDIAETARPFIIPDSTRNNYWQPLINQLDCTTNSANCYADLALITLNPSGSDFINLDPVAGLNPTIFTNQVLSQTTLDTTNSLATTKKAESITLDLVNTVTTE